MKVLLRRAEDRTHSEGKEIEAILLCADSKVASKGKMVRKGEEMTCSHLRERERERERKEEQKKEKGKEMKLASTIF